MLHMLRRIKKTLPANVARVFFCLMLGVAISGCSKDAVDHNNPQAVYNTYCFACHDTGAAGAPLLNNTAFWQTAAQDKATLYQNTLQGVRAMPKKGTCFSCTDQQLKQTVDWMLEQP